MPATRPKVATRPPGATSDESVWSDENATSASSVPPPRRSRTPLFLGLGFLALLAIGGAAVLYLALGGGGSAPPIRAEITNRDGGELLAVRVPGAPAGTKVGFAGEQRPLVNGVASFPLSATALRVGDNQLAIDIIEPDGTVESAKVNLRLDFRVRTDRAGLSASPPVLTVVVDAVPASEVTVDGKPLALDDKGRGSIELPLDDAAEGSTVEWSFRYRVAPPKSAPAEGVLQGRVALTTLQIDRPGTVVVTDKSDIEVAGAVHPQAKVTIDGETVKVDDGRFLYRLALPAVGVYEPKVVAVQEGRVPTQRQLTIRRVEDLTKAAESFEADPSLDYARVAQNPSIYRGQRVDMMGRVYNVDVSAGSSVLQILVKDCPKGQRCPLWVTHGAATDATVNSWVRVLGEVAGEQQFKSESGRVVTVPKVSAEFILPARGS